MTKYTALRMACAALAVGFLAACTGEVDAENYPKNRRDTQRESRGKLTGEGGLKLFGPDDDDASAGASPIGVNSFLWRATLDTLSFMPIASADPFGGVILTDWYEDPNARGERFKINAMILDRSLRVDGIKIKLFKQLADDAGGWRDAGANDVQARKLEDTILTRAREIRVRQGG